jgi:hypothetical protein
VFSPPENDRFDFFTISSGDTTCSDNIGMASFSTSTAWIANLGVFCPIVISTPCVVYEWFWVNGTLTTAHNIDFGLYNEDFTKIQSLGSTVGGTTASAVVNTTTWTDLTVQPGAYYMAMSDDSTRNIACSNAIAGVHAAGGWMEQTSVATLPSPAVPVAYTRAFAPFFGMNCYTAAV